MASTVYRRQSMAQLYEKLRAQDDADDMAWLAQFSPEDKLDEPYIPPAASPAPLSSISSASASTSSPPSPGNLDLDSESSNDNYYLDADSDSDVDPEPLSLDLPHPEYGLPAYPSLIFQPHDLADAKEPADSPYVPPEQDVSPIETITTPETAEIRSSPTPPVSSPKKLTVSPTVTFIPSTAPRRTTRGTRSLSTKRGTPTSSVDLNEDTYSDSEGSASEDEYIPSPSMTSRKRRRATRSAPSTTVAPSKKGADESASTKRPRHSPLPRNVQAVPGAIPDSPAAKSNPWACPYCKWVQRNHRTPDLKRHIRTHTRFQRPAQWVCCGVPLKDAKNYELPADAETYVWGGETMIGGCCKEFSRRDALKRHLDNDHITCIGNFSAFADIEDDD